MHSGASVMLPDDERFDFLFLENDIAQNCQVQMERAYFLLKDDVTRRTYFLCSLRVIRRQSGASLNF